MYVRILPCVAVLALLCAGFGSALAQLVVTKDTVFSVDVFHAPDTVGVANSGSDTLTIDSITIVRDTTQMPHCGITVDLFPVNSQLYCEHYYLNPREPYVWDCRAVVLPPAYTVHLYDWLLRAFEPVLVKSQRALDYTGDTLGAILTFHAGPYRDSLVVMGLGMEPTRTRGPGAAGPVASVARRTSGVLLFDTRGRRVQVGDPSLCTGVYLADGARRVRVMLR